MTIPVVEIENLSKYYGKARGIEHINLRIEEGEVFGFIGPNGAGKTTTIRILLNLIFPSGGSARIMGMDVTEQAKKIMSVTGYVPSDAGIYPSMEVSEFLEFCLRFHRKKNGSERIHELAEAFDLDLTRKIADLSLGNRRKMSIIQSLLHSPRLLILDEPTSGLDPLIQSIFFEILRKENQNGMTILYSSHVLSEVQMHCRRVAIIKEGRIIQVEDIGNLRKKQLKKVFVEYSKDTPVKKPDIQGIDELIESKGNMSFIFSGDINELVSKLAGEDLNNLRIEEPSLEEIFMHYYKE